MAARTLAPLSQSEHRLAVTKTDSWGGDDARDDFDLLIDELRLLQGVARDACQDCGEPARTDVAGAPSPPVLDRYLREA